MDIRQHNNDSPLIGFQSPNCVVVIGTGVGGPQALESILGELPVDFPGTVLVAANMGKGFARVLAEKLNATSQMSVSEAQDGQTLRPSRVLVIPSEYIASIVIDVEKPDSHVIELRRPDPSPKTIKKLDLLMCSAAAMFGIHAIGVILTGIGRDGLIGAQSIMETGGVVLVQNEASAVCFEAPGAIFSAGLVDHVVPLWQLATYISTHATGESNEYAA